MQNVCSLKQFNPVNYSFQLGHFWMIFAIILRTSWQIVRQYWLWFEGHTWIVRATYLMQHTFRIPGQASSVTVLSGLNPVIMQLKALRHVPAHEMVSRLEARTGFRWRFLFKNINVDSYVTIMIRSNLFTSFSIWASHLQVHKVDSSCWSL